jgi:hypothetical protein
MGRRRTYGKFVFTRIAGPFNGHHGFDASSVSLLNTKISRPKHVIRKSRKVKLLRHEMPSPARILGSWVRVSLKA